MSWRKNPAQSKGARGKEWTKQTLLALLFTHAQNHQFPLGRLIFFLESRDLEEKSRMFYISSKYISNQWKE